MQQIAIWVVFKKKHIIKFLMSIFCIFDFNPLNMRVANG